MFDKVPISECMEETGSPPLKGRWIDINKGDARNPKYRSRWVAKQFRGLDSDEWFAATPPIESLRMVLSDAMAVPDGDVNFVDQADPKVLRFTDVSRAFFYAPVRRNIYVELVPEARREKGDESKCARLRMSMYGTKAAAQNWALEVRDQLVKKGFVQGAGSPSIYYHPDSELNVFIHGDDFVTSGKHSQVQWFQSVLSSLHEVKHTLLSPHEKIAKEARILNRTVEWHVGIGISLEADPRHSQANIHDSGASNLKPVSTPITREEVAETEAQKLEYVQQRKAKGTLGAKQRGTGETLTGKDATLYRGIAARANFLSTDRPDLMYAAKELTRAMSEPTTGDWNKVIRLGQYLLAKPRARRWFRYQGENVDIAVHSDTDWAGCKTIRRSTTGGYAVVGGHLIKPWCKTQDTIALSSAEAELYGIVRASSEGLGLVSMYKDVGHDATCTVLGDASAALAIIARQGVGRLRHLDTSLL